ncbi:MAG: Gfo/Idh/MocA family oxidoreductase [Anaerolineae bacterium]|nr:Gfo/Idh/MocA family oxidoreductase [Anaerolineae bacterium]
MLRIAMLSFAHVHANRYARQVIDLPDAELSCIWDDDAARGKAASEMFNVPVFDDLDAVLSRDDVDAVVINAFTSQHPWVIKTALKYGKHVFTEKALTIATSDADEIVDLVKKSGVKFMISLPRRTRSETLFMKQVLDAGWLGDITMMRSRIAHSAALETWFTEEKHNAWFADAELAGGGALFDLGCHTVDIMRWFMGKPKSVVAKINTFSDTYDIDDNSVIVVEFESKALGILDTAWVQQRTSPRPMEIYGTKGYVGSLADGGLILRSTELEPDGVQGFIKPANMPDALLTPMEQWVSAILHGTDMTITVEDGRNLTEMLEGAYRAAREGREITF